MAKLTYQYGGNDSEQEELEISDDLIVVRTVKNMPLEKAVETKTARTTLSRFEMKLSLPDDGVAVLQAKSVGRKSATTVRDDARASLKRLKNFKFAGRALRDANTGEPVVYTENIFIKFQDDVSSVDIEKVLAKHSLSVKKQVRYANNAYFVAAEGRGLEVFEIAQNLLKREDVEYCHPELIRERKSRGASPYQWHLHPATIDGIEIDQHSNVVTAWRRSTGQGIKIAVIDDGVDIDHEEFQSDDKIVAPYDTTNGSEDPRPKDPYADWDEFEDHGTACAGVACADGNFSASGVAPDAKLIPIRLGSGLDGGREGDAIGHAVENGADIISCSWGPPDGEWWDRSDPRHFRRSNLPASTRLALEYAVTQGRNGLGCVVLWAAGNGNESVDLDGYASNSNVIAVAACNDRGKRSIYSDFGNAIWCTFPSNDFGYRPFGHPDPLTPGIWTTDRSNNAGYNPGRRFSWEPAPPGDDKGHYTSTFGGTSSATPGVAGLVALLLAAEPDLHWTEVRDRLKQSCVPIDAQGGSYNADGHSPYYGYGRPDAALLLGMHIDPEIRVARAQDRPPETLDEIREESAAIFSALRSPAWRRRATANRGPKSRRFSQFDEESQHDVMWNLMGFHLAGASIDGDETARLGSVVDFAKRRARSDDPESVRHALAIFATHNSLGRKLLKPRSAFVHPTRFAPAHARETIAPHPEQMMDYWREDALANEHHEHWHEVYPGGGVDQFDIAEQTLGPDGWHRVVEKWRAANGNGRVFINSLTEQEFRACFQLNDRHGELFIYMHQQMLARYDAERRSVGLGPVEPVDLTSGAVDVGYEPGSDLRASLGVSSRPANTTIAARSRNTLSAWRLSVNDAIVNGGVTPSGIGNQELTIEWLGRAIEAVDPRFTEEIDLSSFGNLHNMGHNALSRLSGPNGGVMSFTSVAIRDPIFWRWHKVIDNLGASLLDRQPSFDFSDRPNIAFPNAAGDIALVKFSATADDDFVGQLSAAISALDEDTAIPLGQIDLNNNRSVEIVETLSTAFAVREPTLPGDAEGALVPGAPTAISYLTHDLFGYAIRVMSNAAENLTCTIRIFICPAEDAQRQRAWIEMDKFTSTLTPGMNVVVRRDIDSSVINKPAEDPAEPPQPTPPHETPGPICDCGWPYTLLLPRGTEGHGADYFLTVVVTDTALDLAETDHSCGSMSFCGATDRYPDTREMGYPFSRPFSPDVLTVLENEPSIAFRRFKIAHRPRVDA